MALGSAYVRLAVAGGVAVPGALLWNRQMQRIRSLPRLPHPDYTIDAIVGGDDSDALRLVIVGDSLVAGVGAPTLAQSMPWVLACELTALIDRAVHVKGFGRPSARVLDVLNEQLERVPGDADIVVIVAGANDIMKRTPPPAFSRAFDALLSGMAERTDATVVVTGMPDFRSVGVLHRGFREAVGAWADHLHGRQRRIAERHGAVFVDCKAQVAQAFRSDTTLLGEDRFHPSPFGYALLARVLAPALADVAQGIAVG